MAEGVGEHAEVAECPDCGQKGHYDGRVLVGGRGVYRCPEGHRWQDADEKPTNKGASVVSPPPHPRPEVSKGIRRRGETTVKEAHNG
jgi:hypothetical protein